MSFVPPPVIPFDERLSTGDLAWLKSLFERETGIQLQDDKEAMVNGRLLARVRALNLTSLADYVARVRLDRDEQTRVIDALTTHETFFFREPAHFALLQKFVRGRLHVRVWSAACSTGEEAASIAMALAEVMSPSAFEVVGTDISPEAVKRAQSGLFPLERADLIDPERRRRFLRKGTGDFEGTFCLTPELEERQRFEVVNLLAPPSSLGLFDVIFLRNVLIYFDDRRRAQVVRCALTHLKPGGLLLPGHAEQVRDCSSRLTQVGVASYRYD